MAPKPDKDVDMIREEISQSESTSSAGSDREAKDSSTSESDADSDSDSSNAASSDADSELSASSKSRPYGPYKPPVGFKQAKKQTPTPPPTSSILSDLRGKQVFHITAPAFLPLSKVKEVSLAQVMKGEPVLKHDGVKYGIPVDSQKEADSGETLFLYDTKSQTYHSTTANIPSYHIQELIDLPGSENDAMIIEAARKVEKPPRKQPKHLKMRFRPVGSGDGPAETIGSSSESEGEQPKFKVLQGLEKEKERKRKHQQTEGDGNQVAGIPRKKSKKHPSGNEEAASVEQEKSKKSGKNRDGKKRKKSEKSA